MVIKYTCKNFHAERFMIAFGPEVRRHAAENIELTADAYFMHAEQFLSKSPQYAVMLRRPSDAAAMEELQIALERLGCKDLASDADNIRSALAAGKQYMAEKWAAEIFDKFAALCDDLKTAHIKKRFAAKSAGAARTTDAVKTTEPAKTADTAKTTDAAKTGDTPESPDSGVLLSEALEWFDYEEAHRKLRILAVDDVTVVLNTITSILSPHYEVFALTKASQVEQFLSHTTPELFLLDIEMPELSGYDLVSVIRGFEKHKDTPIIFLTGNATMENIKNAVASGAADFITKPVNREVLLEKIENKIVWKKAF